MQESLLKKLGNASYLKKLQQEVKSKIKKKTQFDFLTGDVVKIIDGPDKNKFGKIKSILKEIDHVIVEGINTRFRTIINDGELYTMPIDGAIPSNCISLVNPVTLQPITVEWKSIDTGFGYSRRGRMIIGENKELPFPINRAAGMMGPKDTSSSAAFEVTYKPDMNTPPLPYGCII